MVVPNLPSGGARPTGAGERSLLTHAAWLLHPALHLPRSLINITNSLLFLAHGISDTNRQGGTSLSPESRSFPFHLFKDILASALQASWELDHNGPVPD